ncbi:peptidoglycan-binding protein lysM [Micromonospora sp. ATCC 39149]|uniref:LysM peptidoglycan-binding domain-containing protein n=1 Tax=Micromonospora carbonacea TaxID=47853 RepID=A0A7D6C7I3_9ACTN|nr:LysM domain-containing protein [Micromonospora sp. ATCC 39149]EEP72746.1 peptidoglycan-binding protein lysM [Micromonospora sp. ATCC 39149]QLJ98847.1 LysM peptidoglycan-binding domain-containing protein [Micromonospora carbonacea]
MAAPGRSAVRRVGQVLTGFGALVVLIAVLVGGPVALIAFAGNPLPDHVPTLAEIGATLTSRDDGQLFLRALALVGWFGWATFAFSVLVELGAQSLRRPAPRLPGMSRQQRAAAALVGSVALIVAASPAAASAATVLSGPYPAAVAPAVAAPAARPVTATPVVDARSATPVADLPRETEPAVYRVAKGDYLGEVAERYLDDFDRYRDVAKLNRLRDPDRIRPGQLITLPDGVHDAGARTHATGKLVVRPTTPAPGGTTTPRPPSSPANPPAADAPAAPGATPPSSRATRPTPGPSAAQPTGQPPAGSSSAGSSHGTQQIAQPPGGPQPAMAAGASRAGAGDQVNRPLAVSAVLAVASIVGAQIGAVLGLRRRPAIARATSGARALVTGRHRRD